MEAVVTRTEVNEFIASMSKVWDPALQDRLHALRARAFADEVVKDAVDILGRSLDLGLEAQRIFPAFSSIPVHRKVVKLVRAILSETDKVTGAQKIYDGSRSTVVHLRVGERAVVVKYYLDATMEGGLIGRLLDHPHLLPTLFALKKGIHVMPYIRCQTLLDWYPFLDNKNMEIICRQVLEALAYLHCNGYVHRDIKPDNIGVKCLEDPTKACLFDYDLLQKQGSMQQGGTWGYTPPEAKQPSDYPMDMWGLGILLWQFIHRNKALKLTPDGEQYYLAFPNQKEMTDLAYARDIQGLLTSVEKRREWHLMIREDNPEFPRLVKVMRGCLQVEPRARLTAEGALKVLSE